MELYHASKEIVQYPEVRKARYTKDFSWGFYCTNNFKQAVRWANKQTSHDRYLSDPRQTSPSMPER